MGNFLFLDVLNTLYMGIVSFCKHRAEFNDDLDGPATTSQLMCKL